MHKTDYLSLDGSLLRLFVLIYDLGSVSRAAEHLSINQSSASHGLERLRRITGDPLFVRSGRGITPTARADALLDSARMLLRELEQFTEPGTYNPQEDQGIFTVAANDYEAEIALQPLMKMLRKFAPGVTLRVTRAYSTQDWAALLRNNETDLVLAPTLQSGEADLVQQTLFSDRHACFFDPGHAEAPETLDAYCAASHAVMLSGQLKPTEIDRKLKAQNRERPIAITAPSFSILATMIKGTDIIATMPSRLQGTLFADFECGQSPVEIEPFSIAQIWHSRNHASPRHQWLRKCLRDLFL